VDPRGFRFGPEGEEPLEVTVTRTIVQPDPEGGEPIPTGAKVITRYRNGRQVERREISED
jgi:hypothetical protein